MGILTVRIFRAIIVTIALLLHIYSKIEAARDQRSRG